MSEVNLNIGVSGTYELLVHNNGKLRTKTEVFKNLITDAGLNEICISGNDLFTTGSTYTNRCVVGTGTNAPLPTDTVLQTQVMGSIANSHTVTASYYKYDMPDRYVGFAWQAQFAIDGYIGTITEVGIKYGAVDNILFSRALLPIPLELIPGDQLTVIYKLYNSIPDTPFNFNISDGVTNYTVTCALARWRIDQIGTGVSYSYGILNSGVYGRASVLMTLRAAETDILDPENNISLSAGFSTDRIFTTYVPGSFQTKILYRFSISQANFPTGIGRLQLESNDSQGAFQFKFAPKILKTNTNRLELIIKFTFSRGTPPV